MKFAVTILLDTSNTNAMHIRDWTCVVVVIVVVVDVVVRQLPVSTKASIHNVVPSLRVLNDCETKVGSTGGETELKTLKEFSRCIPAESALS